MRCREPAIYTAFASQSPLPNLTASFSSSHQASTPMACRQRAPYTYPQPLIVPPSHPTGHHTHTLILLHGRGSNATRFADALLASKTSHAGKTLADHFPTVKFIFPTAKPRRAQVYRRALLNQWFDLWSLRDDEGWDGDCGAEEEDDEEGEDGEESGGSISEKGNGGIKSQGTTKTSSSSMHKQRNSRPDLQYEGIAETSAYISSLIQREAEESFGGDKRKVVLGGLSQGCAAALCVLLQQGEDRENGSEGGSGQENALGGFIGMSGWLPFANEYRDALRWHPVVAAPRGVDANDNTDDVSDEIDFFDRDATPAPPSCDNLQHTAANLARQIAFMPELQPNEHAAFRKTAVFLGHGRKDEKVPFQFGQKARDVLVAYGCHVVWGEYDEGHWYKVPEEIDDIVQFLKEIVNGDGREGE